MSDSYRVVSGAVVDMRPAGPTPPTPQPPYHLVVDAVVDMRPAGPDPPTPPAAYHVVVDDVVPMRWLTEPLDYLPEPRLAAWSRRVRAGYAGGGFLASGGPADQEAPFLPYGPVDAGRLDLAFLERYAASANVAVARDQSGRGNDLARVSSGPRASFEHGPECEGPTPVWRFSGAGGELRRDDALGLVSDPALTIAWKARGSRDYDASPRALLALGTAAAPELVLATQVQADGDRVLLAGPAPSLAHGAFWSLPAGTLKGWHSYVVTKPAATGYYALDWRLRVDGVDVGQPSLSTGVLALGATRTELGGAPGVLGAEAQLAGLMLWDSVLDVDQLALLQRFLDQQSQSSEFALPSEPFALGEDGAFWTLDGVYLSWA